MTTTTINVCSRLGTIYQSYTDFGDDFAESEVSVRLQETGQLLNCIHLLHLLTCPAATDETILPLVSEVKLKFHTFTINLCIIN